MADEQRIVVEVPSDRGYLPVASTIELSRLEEFKKGWRNALALPDNLPDLAFDLTASLTIPALFTSCLASLPLPCFLQLAIVWVSIAAGAFFLYLQKVLPEIQSVLLMRVGLMTLGVALGL